jgi:hypothetical protein
MAQMENKKTYDFEVYAPNVLGTGFKRIEILGYFPFETAIVLQPDLAPVHAEVYSSGRLPAGTPNDPRQYNWYRIKKPDGSITMLGEPWIDQASIREVAVGAATCTLPNVTTTDLIRLRDMFTQAGFVDFEIKFGN